MLHFRSRAEDHEGRGSEHLASWILACGRLEQGFRSRLSPHGEPCEILECSILPKSAPSVKHRPHVDHADLGRRLPKSESVYVPSSFLKLWDRLLADI